MATSDDIWVTDKKVEDDIFSDPPPAAVDPRACHLALHTLNNTPMVDNIVPTAASNILGVNTDIPSPPATNLSYPLLSPPMMRGFGEGFLLVTVTQGRHTTPPALAVQYPASVEMVPMNSFGALSAVSLENSMDPKRDSSPTPPITTSSLQALVDNTCGVFFGRNNCAPLRLKEIFNQELRVVDWAVDIPVEREHHIATTMEPAMIFAQLMELATTTAMTVALISASMGSLKDATANLQAATTENMTSIASLVEITKENKASLLTLGNQLEDINMTVGTLIIRLKNAIATAIERLENASYLSTPQHNCRGQRH